MFYLSRGEQIVLFVLLAAFLVGGGLLIYTRGQSSTRGSSREPIFIDTTLQNASPEGVVGAQTIVSPPRVNERQLPKDAKLSGDLATAKQSSLGKKQANLGKIDANSHKLISLNRTTAEELETLPGIGPVFARRIIEYRERLKRERGHGFESIDELLNVSGIGPKRLATLREHVTP